MTLEEKAEFYSKCLKQLGYEKVVRCKNCEYASRSVSEFGMPEIICEFTECTVYEEDYCSHGVSK